MCRDWESERFDLTDYLSILSYCLKGGSHAFQTTNTTSSARVAHEYSTSMESFERMTRTMRTEVSKQCSTRCNSICGEDDFHRALIALSIGNSYAESNMRRLAFHVSHQGNTIEAYLFIKELVGRYGRKSIWTDDTSWRKEVCRWLQIKASKHQVYPQRQNNLIEERMNQVSEDGDRVGCFDDSIPLLQG
jgi:hypothetical protein